MSLNRRTFLLGSTYAAVVTGANDRPNIGVIGVGGRGTYHVGALVKRPEVEVTAVCDVDTGRTERAVQTAYKAGRNKPKAYTDMRTMLEDKSLDAVFIAATNHWHALATIWACEAGKDVYVEKPATYNILESDRVVAAARKYGRIVQVGMQRRSLAHKRRAVELLRQGYIGKLYMARGICYKRRQAVGHKPDVPVPPGVNWDLFLGPAPMRPYNENRRISWHYMWDTGNGDIGNQGIHEMDIARWGLNKNEHPKSVYCGGGKFIDDDDRETPNAQIAIFDYGDAELTFEVRSLMTGAESEMSLRGQNFIGNMFYGSAGYMLVEDSGFKTFLGDKRKPGEAMTVQEAVGEIGGEENNHVNNFLQVLKSRKYQDLNSDILEGARSANLVHLANISYRTGRKLILEPEKLRVIGDEAANAMFTRHPYRAPYVVA
jgi:predicted dehydrogenase